MRVSSSRHIQSQALILKNNRIGEIHKGVLLFTPSQGLLHAIAHGAYARKGKLKGITNPFTLGRVFLYGDPVKNSLKITDFLPEHFFEGLRENIRKYYIACLWAELIIKSHGGGESGAEAFNLICNALELLDVYKEEESLRLSLQYLHRFLLLLGAFPDLNACGTCGSDPAESSGLVYYEQRDHLLCGNCVRSDASESPSGLFLPPGAVRYLRHTRNLSLSQAMNVGVADESLGKLKCFLYALCQSVIEQELLTLQSGADIL